MLLMPGKIRNLLQFLPGWRCVLLLLPLIWALNCLGARAQADAQVSLRDMVASGEQISSVSSDLNFDVEALESHRKWIPDLISRADAARRVLNAETNDALLVRIRILFAPTQEAFLQLAGGGTENSYAVSLGNQQTLVINGAAVRSEGPDSLNTVLVHELAHVYLDVRAAGRVPRWMHEGVAQMVAGQWTMEDQVGLIAARFTNQLIPLSEIESSFPAQVERQRLAYRESFSVVKFLVEERFDYSLPAFLASITGEENSHALRMYWNPLFRDALQASWRGSLGSPWQLILVLTSSGGFWGLMAILVVVAYFVKRRRSKALRQEWAEEDKVYLVLDEEEKRAFGDLDPDELVKPEPGEYEDPEYEDVYENGEWRGIRRKQD